jgi:hypothetical protein
LGEVVQHFNDTLDIRNIILDEVILLVRIVCWHFEDSLAKFLVCESVVVRGRRQRQVRLLM